MPSRKDLANALLEERILKQDALDRARREQEKSGRPLFSVILDLGLCTEDAFFHALRRKSGAQVVGEEQLTGKLVPRSLRPAVPQALAFDQGVLPISLEHTSEGKRVGLAMVDPLAEIPRIKAALARLGVIEIHRFLIHRAVLRRCLPSVYADPSTDREVPLTDQPTGILSLPMQGGQNLQAAQAASSRRPKRPPRNDEKTEQLPGRGGAAITQPLLQVAPLSPALGSSSVQVDPGLMAEIELIAKGRPTEPMPAATLPSEDKTPVLPPVLPARRVSAPTQPMPMPLAPVWPLPPLGLSGVSPPRRPTARMTTLAKGTNPHAVPVLPPATLSNLLRRTVHALLRELEDRLRRPTLPRASELAELVEESAARLQMPEREELGLLSQIYSALRLLVQVDGTATEVPRDLASGLGLCLHDLEVALYGVEEDSEEPPSLEQMPSGRRRARMLILTSATALYLRQQGLEKDEFVARLRAEWPGPLTEAVLAVLALQNAPPDPERTHELALPEGGAARTTEKGESDAAGRPPAGGVDLR